MVSDHFIVIFFGAGMKAKVMTARRITPAIVFIVFDFFMSLIFIFSKLILYN